MLRVITVLFLSTYCLGRILADDSNVSKVESGSVMQPKNPMEDVSTDSEVEGNNKGLSASSSTATDESNSLEDKARSVMKPIVSNTAPTSPSGMPPLTANVPPTESDQTKPSNRVDTVASSNNSGSHPAAQGSSTTSGTSSSSSSDASPSLNNDKMETKEALTENRSLATPDRGDAAASSKNSGSHATDSRSARTDASSREHPRNSSKELSTKPGNPTSVDKTSANTHEQPADESPSSPSLNNDKVETKEAVTENGSFEASSLGSIINLMGALLLIGFAPRYI